MHETRGRIVDGILITDPIPEAWLPIYWVSTPAERLIRDMQLRLELTETGAKGILGGYEDLKIWWSSHSRGIGGSGGVACGLLVASLLFGLCHWVNKEYAVTTFLIGLYFGGLMIWSGTFLVPAVSHFLFDWVAFIYIVKWSHPRGAAGSR